MSFNSLPYMYICVYVFRNVDAACIIFNAGLVNTVCTKELFFIVKRNGYSEITVKLIKQLQCSQNIW